MNQRDAAVSAQTTPMDGKLQPEEDTNPASSALQPPRAGLLQAMAERRRLSAGNRQWLTSEAFVFTAWLISTFLPKQRWYAAALWISRLMTTLGRRLAPPAANVTEASLLPRLLHRFLDLLSTYDAFFPIPVRVEGEEILRSYMAQPGGFVCCSAHIPFVKLFLPLARRIIADGRQLRVIAREPVGNEEVSAWGDEHWKAIRTDHAVLLHTRSLLRQNGCLLVAVDKEQGDIISANIFRFVGKMHSRILMWFTQLQPDGTILLRILLPPGPGCRSEEEIRANLEFVAENVRRILQGDRMIGDRAAKNSMLEQKEEDAWSRDMHRIQLYSNDQLETQARRLQALLEGGDETLRHRERIEWRLAMMQAELRARGVRGRTVSA